MSSKQQRIRLVGAFAALATLALAVSCKGFFVNPTLTSIVSRTCVTQHSDRYHQQHGANVCRRDLQRRQLWQSGHSLEY